MAFLHPDIWYWTPEALDPYKSAESLPDLPRDI
jgi:hypothetical protein